MRRRFLRDRRGAAALEFALIAWLMVSLCFGMTELYFRFDVSQKVTMAALQTADLTAQSALQTTASLEDLREATRKILEPLDTEGLVVEIASIGIDTAGQPARVLWRDSNGAQLLSESDLKAAEALIEPGGSTIWVGVQYEYEPPGSFIIKGATLYEQIAFSRPRLTRRIALNGRSE